MLYKIKILFIIAYTILKVLALVWKYKFIIAVSIVMLLLFFY